MSRRIVADVRVLGGLPLQAVIRAYPAEPDVGIFHEQLELEELNWASGRPVPESIWDRFHREGLDGLFEQLEGE